MTLVTLTRYLVRNGTRTRLPLCVWCTDEALCASCAKVTP